MNGTNYTAAGHPRRRSRRSCRPARRRRVAGFGGGDLRQHRASRSRFGGTLAATNVPGHCSRVHELHGGRVGLRRRDRQGRRGRQQGRDRSRRPATDPGRSRLRPAYTIPLRTPFALTGSATDADGDPLLYSWEQNDRGGAAGTSLLSNTKTNGPLFAMFPMSGQISAQRHAALQLAGREPPDDDPTRVFPDLAADPRQQHERRHRLVPAGRRSRRRCRWRSRSASRSSCRRATTSASPATNASPLSLHFRLTARDGKGGVERAADTTLLLATGAGPFLVTSPDPAVAWPAGSTQTVTWDVAGTDVAAGQHGEREDLALDSTAGTRTRTCSRRARRTTAREAVARAEHGDDERPHQGRGGREHLLRHLERGLRRSRSRASSGSTARRSAARTR